MKLKLFIFSLLITFFNNSLLGEENSQSKDLNLKNSIQNTLENKNSDNLIIHVVKKGDTLSSISKRYSIKKELIIKANKLLDENYIYVGQNLKIIGNSLPDNSSYQKKNFYHEIKKGETLTEIANKYNLTVSELTEINKIENQKILTIGTKLKLIEEISTREETPVLETKDQINVDKIKQKKYGPLIITSKTTIIKKRKKFLEASHENGKRLILQISCEKKEINVRGVGRKWKGWMPARELFEIELLNDFCRDFDEYV